MAELVKFQQKTDSEIDATPVTDGLLMFSTTTGSGRIAMDYAGVRNEMGGNDITVDSVLSLVSENPVQNKVITEEIESVSNDVTNVENTYTQSFPSCETYSSSATYAINDYVIYSSALYRCIVAIPVAEAWNSAHWASINSTNIGLIYNTTDSSFYGRSGADSVLKKLGGKLPVFYGTGSGSSFTKTIPSEYRAIFASGSYIAIGGMTAVNATLHAEYTGDFDWNATHYISIIGYNSSTGIVSLSTNYAYQFMTSVNSTTTAFALVPTIAVDGAISI